MVRDVDKVASVLTWPFEPDAVDQLAGAAAWWALLKLTSRAVEKKLPGRRVVYGPTDVKVVDASTIEMVSVGPRGSKVQMRSESVVDDIRSSEGRVTDFSINGIPMSSRLVLLQGDSQTVVADVLANKMMVADWTWVRTHPGEVERCRNDWSQVLTGTMQHDRGATQLSGSVFIVDRSHAIGLFGIPDRTGLDRTTLPRPSRIDVVHKMFDSEFHALSDFVVDP